MTFRTPISRFVRIPLNQCLYQFRQCNLWFQNSIYVRDKHAADAPQEPLRCSEKSLFIKFFLGEVSASLKTSDFTKSLPVLSKELTKILSQLFLKKYLYICQNTCNQWLPLNILNKCINSPWKPNVFSIFSITSLI